VERKANKLRAKFPVAVHLFLLCGDQVLLLRRFNTGYEDGNYSVPAGHIDGGESVRLAMVREAREELGIEVRPDDLIFAGVFHRKSDDERVDFFLGTRSWDGEMRNNEPEKCDQIKWFALDELPNNMVPYVRRALEAYQRGEQFVEYGW